MQQNKATLGNDAGSIDILDIYPELNNSIITFGVWQVLICMNLPNPNKMYIGLTPSHFEIACNSKGLKKLRSIQKDEKKLLSALTDQVDSFTLYSLQENFSSFIEYDAYATLDNYFNPRHCSISIPSEIFATLNEEYINEVIQQSKSFLDFKEGEIFECHYNENPFFYIIKEKEAKDMPNYKHIQHLK